MKPVEVFFSYAHEDEHLMDAVRQQLVIFERQGRIIKWHDRMIPPGAEWEAQIDRRLRMAHIILLFVSPSFLESRYCYDVEVAAALDRHTRGEARVIPIILRPCAEGWFEYRGELSPRELQELALATGLEIVHCGATLALDPGRRKPSSA